MSFLKHIFSGALFSFFKTSIKDGFEQYLLISNLQKRYPSAKIDGDVKIVSPQNIYLSSGVKIDKGCYLNAGGINHYGRDGNITLGDHVIIGYNSILFAGGGKIVLGSLVRLGIGCIISAMSEDSFANPEATPENHEHIHEIVIIGNNCMIGGGAIILGGTTLGDNCIVGSGAVVKGKYPDHTTLIGNPARAIPRLPFQK